MEKAASRDVLDKFANIVKELKKNGFQISYNEDKMKKQIFGIEIDKLKKLEPCLEGIGKSIDKFMSDDPVENIEGALILVAGITAMIPEVGTVVGAMFTMFASVLSAFGGKKKTGMAEVLDNVIQKAFDKYDDMTLKRELAGIKTELVNIHSYLNAFTETNIYRRDEVLAWNTKIATIAVSFLGQLWHEIKKYSVNNSSKDYDDVAFQATRAVDYAEAFCQLSAMRDIILTQYYCILMNVGDYLESTAVGIWADITRCQQQEKELAELMSSKYTIENAYFISVFHKFERPTTTALLNRFHMSADSEIDTNYERLSIQIKGKTYYADTTHEEAKWDGHFFETEGREFMTCDSRYHAVLELIKIKEGNICHIKIGRHYISDSYNHRNGSLELGEPIKWKLVRLQEAGKTYYLIASMKYPIRFLYMHFSWFGWHRRLRMTEGLPGPKGYWYFD